MLYLLSYRSTSAPGGTRTRDLSIRSREPEAVPARSKDLVAVVWRSRDAESNRTAPKAALP
jgi:hypothetical protein